MPRAEQYLQHAIEAERQAERARDRDAKEGLLEIARQWRELAQRGEPLELEPTGSLSADWEECSPQLVATADCASSPGAGRLD